MRRIKLTLDYVGTRFSGWQCQPKKDTVQQRVENALSQLTGEQITVIASGRTDTGVHAMAQVVHFDTNTQYDTVAYVRGANNFLPPDIRILKAEIVDETFHARFSAKSKTYMYLCYISAEKKAIYSNRAVCIKDRLDEDAIAKTCKILEGTHDFTSFMSCGSEVKTTIRTIEQARFEKVDDEYRFYFTANGFLYNMVRKIMACIMRVGSGKMTVEQVQYALDNPSKTALTLVAPAEGLYLVNVDY